MPNINHKDASELPDQMIFGIYVVEIFNNYKLLDHKLLFTFYTSILVIYIMLYLLLKIIGIMDGDTLHKIHGLVCVNTEKLNLL